MRKTIAFLLLGAASLPAPAPASAAALFDGHYYEFVATGTDFAGALAAAAAATPIPGFTAHLVTISSVEENDFVTNVLTNDTIWLAGSDAETEGVWKWVAGPEAGQIFYGPGVQPGAYSAWNPGEPNNQGDEDALHANYSGGWNDISINASYFYVVEWSPLDTPPPPPGVPEPASWAMMIGGFALAGAAMRRRRVRIAFAG